MVQFINHFIFLQSLLFYDLNIVKTFNNKVIIGNKKWVRIETRWQVTSFTYVFKICVFVLFPKMVEYLFCLRFLFFSSFWLHWLLLKYWLFPSFFPLENSLCVMNIKLRPKPFLKYILILIFWELIFNSCIYL